MRASELTEFLPLDYLFLFLRLNRIVATPGRLMHLILEMKLELKTIEYIVFDEADRYEQAGRFTLDQKLVRLS